MRAGLIQLTASDDPVANLPQTLDLVRIAARDGAEFVLTPEVTNCVSTDRHHQENVLRTEVADLTLASLREEAVALDIWLLIGSLALKQEDGDRFVNRSFLIAPDGRIAAWYDKIHMFDVDISETESYRESAGYRPGDRALVASMGDTVLGMTVCYDLRFPRLYRDLAQGGAQILSVPAAFSPETGFAHWEPLLRARAVENGCFVLAPAQCGTHAVTAGRQRKTHGHSLAVDPWGKVLADGGDRPGITLVDLDLSLVDDTRARVPSLRHDRKYEKP